MNTSSHPETEERGEPKPRVQRAVYTADEVLRAELRAFRDNSNGQWNNTSIGSDIGYSGVVVGDYLGEYGNKYAGDTRGVERKVREFLRDQRLLLDTSVETIECEIAKQVANAIEDIRTAKLIGVIIGAPGIGKSRGIDLYCRTHERAIPFRAWTGEKSLSAAEECLFKAADVARSKRGVNEAKTLAGKLAGSSRPIIADDAHKLTCAALQLFYDLRDKTGSPIVLAGDERLIAKLKNDPQRLRRTGTVHRLKIKEPMPLIEHHIKQIIPDCNGELSALKALCKQIVEQPGHFGSVQMELCRAVRIKRAKADLSWCEAVRHAHRRLIRDYELV